MYIVNVVTGKILFGLESTEVCSGVFVNSQSILLHDVAESFWKTRIEEIATAAFSKIINEKKKKQHRVIGGY